MKEKEVRDELWKRFERWMRGQTVQLHADGVEYYDHDVARFLVAMDRIVEGLRPFD